MRHDFQSETKERILNNRRLDKIFEDKFFFEGKLNCESEKLVIEGSKSTVKCSEIHYHGCKEFTIAGANSLSICGGKEILFNRTRGEEILLNSESRRRR